MDGETNKVRTCDDDTSRNLRTGGAEEARRRMSLVRAFILFVTRRRPERECVLGVVAWWGEVTVVLFSS